MNLCLQGGDFETATLILTKLDKEQHIIVGHPDITCLDLFIDTCIENKNMAKALVRNSALILAYLFFVNFHIYIIFVIFFRLVFSTLLIVDIWKQKQWLIN